MPQNTPPKQIVDMQKELYALRAKYQAQSMGIYWINSENQILTISDNNHEFVRELDDLVRMYLAHNVGLAQEDGEMDSFYKQGDLDG